MTGPPTPPTSDPPPGPLRGRGRAPIRVPAPALDLRAKNANPTLAWLMILGGLALFGFTVLLMLVALVASSSPLPHTLTFTFVFPIIIVVFGVAKLGAHRRVIVTDPELIIVKQTGARRIRWGDIAEVRVGRDSDTLALSFNTKLGKEPKGAPRPRTLTLLNDRGRKIEQIKSASFDRFDDLVDEIELRSTDARGAQTRDVVKESHEAARKGKRTGTLMLALGLFFLAIIVTLGIMELTKRAEERALADSGIAIRAEITDHRMHNGIAPRIEYRFIDPAGLVREKDVMVERGEWRRLDGERTVEVVYLPADPSVHRLARGEVDPNEMDPFVLGALFFLGPVLALFLIAGGILAIRGYDLSVENGRVRVERFGKPLDDPEDTPD